MTSSASGMLRLLKSTPLLAAFVDFISSSPCAATLAGRLGNLSNGLFALAEFCGACGGQESEALFLNLNPAPEAWINPGQGSRLI
jgi:hypothetical protein